MQCTKHSSVIGTCCTENQDACVLVEREEFSVHGVFDGIQSRCGSGTFTHQLVGEVKTKLEAMTEVPTPKKIIAIVNEIRQGLMPNQPAAGCSFIMLVDVYQLPYQFYVWAGDCRLGRNGGNRLTWLTPPHTNMGILTNRLLAKRPCTPSVGAMARKHGSLILASDGYWANIEEDDRTVVHLAK